MKLESKRKQKIAVVELIAKTEPWVNNHRNAIITKRKM